MTKKQGYQILSALYLIAAGVFWDKGFMAPLCFIASIGSVVISFAAKDER